MLCILSTNDNYDINKNIISLDKVNYVLSLRSLIKQHKINFNAINVDYFTIKYLNYNYFLFKFLKVMQVYFT